MSTFGQQARRAWTAQPSATAEELERQSAVYLHAGQMARNLAVATRKIAALERDVKCLRADLAAAKATSGSKDTNMSDVAAMAMKKLERIEEQRRSRRRRRRERLKATPGAAGEPACNGTGAADFAAGENRDAPMEFADSEEPGCDEEAERAAAPLVELDQAAADSDGGMGPATVGGRSGRRRLSAGDANGGGRDAGGGRG